jgi:acyl-CoA thioesterase
MENKEQQAEFLERLRRKLSTDYFAALAGIEIVDASPGYAKTKMAVEKKHLNAAGVVQGGAIFTLADFAFAAATNYGEQVALAIDCQLSFLHPTRDGVLWAETEQIGDSKNLTSYLIRITDGGGRTAAQFYGRAYKKEPVKPCTT